VKLKERFASFQLQSRVLVALCGIPLLVASAYLGIHTMLILWTLIWFFMLNELANIIIPKESNRSSFVFLALVYFIALTALLNYPAMSTFILFYSWLAFPLSIWLLINYGKKNHVIVQWAYVNYVTLPVLFLLIIFKAQGFNAILLMLMTVWALDTFSYFTGIAFGRHPIAPLISPKKTIEGTLGGIIGASLVFFYLIRVFNIPFHGINSYLWGILITLCAFTGDLLESFIKRQFNIKDSGTILRGHGGMLDRFDSLLFLLYAYVLVLLP
jgi:phosphatidate cytidylyltransferase